MSRRRIGEEGGAQIAIRLGNENYPHYAASRKLDSLRGDPRFRELMEDLKRRFDERTARR